MKKRAVWKYKIPLIESRVSLHMPVGATFLHAAVFHVRVTAEDHVYLWFEVDPSDHAPKVARHFELKVTGEIYEANEARKYLATLVFDAELRHMVGSNFITHIFEIERPEGKDETDGEAA